MGNYNIGPRIGIEGEKEFRQQIKNINDAYKAMEAETRAVTAAFEANGDEQGKLEAMSRQLEKQIDLQKQKMEALQDAVNKASAKYEENSIEATRLRGALYDTQATITTLQNRLKDCEQSLENAAEAEADAISFTDKLKSSLKNLDTESKLIKAETEKLTAAFDANGDQQGKLEAIGRQLEKQIDNQKKKVDLLAGALVQAKVEFGEESDEVKNLQIDLYKAQSAVSKMEGELKDTSNRLNQAEDATGKFADEMDDAGDRAIEFGDILKANLASDLISKGLEKAGELVKNFASGIIEAAADSKATNAQFTQTFGNLEDAARGALESISDDTNIAATRMQQSYTRIYAFAKTTGAESDAALDIASRAMVAAADSAAYYDRSIEDVTETLQSFLKGNYANDAALGISATEVSRNTMANQLYAKSFKELSEAQKVDTLLAMVEAGNAASGAIGQAARESDSWENVTGELSEAWRQLQAQVGKPVLQKAVPIIQKITDKANELIDDVDWDEFGDKFEKVADTLIDNGPQIIKTITSLSAGFVAFKATKKAGEIATMASSFIKLATGAKTAGTAVAASGAAAAASPWGLAAVAIGGAVSLVTSFALETKTCTDSLTKSVDDLRETFRNAETTYKDTATDINSTAVVAEQCAIRLKELESAGLDNAAANREYELTVEKLNELIPELNLVIDEQTGIVNKNYDAIMKSIEAWQEEATLEAMQDRFTDELKAQAEAKAEVLDATVRLHEEEKKGKSLSAILSMQSARLQVVTESLKKAREKMAKADGLSAEEAEVLSQEIQTLRLEEEQLYAVVKNYEGAVADNKEEQKDLNGQIEYAKSVVESYEDDIRRAKDALDLLTKETVEQTDEQTELDAKIQAVQENVQELAVAYGKARDAARESLDSQIGLFDEINTESEQTASDILKIWENQQKAFSDYNKNLDKAVELGLDEKLVEQLSDGSEESMRILNLLVNNNKIRIADINKQFTELETAKNTVADTMAEIESTFDDSLERIVEQAQESGVNALDGLILGLDIKKWETHIKKLAQSWEVYDEEMDINSPSGVAMRSAEFTGEGAIIGLDNTIADYERKMQEFARVGQSAYLSERLARAESYPEMYATPTYTTNSTTTRTTNLGGFTFNIYAQPGQDAYEIAEAVQEIIQTQIAREEAGL